MDNNEMSFESIFNMGVGIKPVAKVNTTSVERFDGDLDTLFSEVAHSEEQLNYLESFDSVNKYNTTAKLRMLAKIDKNYSKCNRGIESYVRSMEADAAEADAPTVAEDKKPAEQPKEMAEKKEKWYKTALKAVVNFFKSIWHAIVKFIKTIVAAISNKFNEAKLNKMAKKEGASAAVKFAKSVQDMFKKLDPVVKKLSSAADSILKESFSLYKDVKLKKNEDVAANWKESTLKMHAAAGYQIISASMKLMTTFEKIVYKSFTKFRASVIKGSIKTVGNGKIEQFVNGFNKCAVMLINAINSIKIGKEDGRFYTSVDEETKKLIKDYAGIDISGAPIQGGTLNASDKDRQYIKRVNAYITEVNNKLSEEKTFNNIGKTLFGIVEDPSAAPTEDKKEETK